MICVGLVGEKINSVQLHKFLQGIVKVRDKEKLVNAYSGMFWGQGYPIRVGFSFC